jgi:glycosyltransferase involved in cell wall biosynthesis
LHVSYWDLCELGYTLQQGFLRLTDSLGFWPVTYGASWLEERFWWRIGDRDAELPVIADMMDVADIIHLNGAYWQSDLPLEKLGGKKVVVHKHGQDDYRQNPQLVERVETQAGFTRLASTPDLLIHGDAELRRNLRWLPSPIDLAEIDQLYPRWAPRGKNESMRVLHSYTVPESKGTPDIIRLVNEAKDSGANLELDLCHRVQRRESFWYNSQCDVFFATLLYGPGLATLECMAFGKPVLVGCNEQELKAQLMAADVKRAEDLPWIWVTPETAVDVLRELAASERLRRDWGERGRAYIERVHALPVVVALLKRIYEAAGKARSLQKRGSEVSIL